MLSSDDVMNVRPRSGGRSSRSIRSVDKTTAEFACEQGEYASLFRIESLMTSKDHNLGVIVEG